MKGEYESFMKELGVDGGSAGGSGTSAPQPTPTGAPPSSSTKPKVTRIGFRTAPAARPPPPANAPWMPGMPPPPPQGFPGFPPSNPHMMMQMGMPPMGFPPQMGYPPQMGFAPPVAYPPMQGMPPQGQAQDQGGNEKDFRPPGV